MMFVKLYSGQDGQSHFEELETRKGSTLFSKTHTGVEVVFKNNPPSQSAEWHTAPRRHYLITLSGTVEVGIGDGPVKTFGSGDVFWPKTSPAKATPLSRKTTGQER